MGGMNPGLDVLGQSLAGGSAGVGSLMSSAAAQQHQMNALMNNSVTTAKTAYPYESNRIKTDLNARITQAVNGWVILIDGEAHIAPTLEDVSLVITSQLASRMLDRTDK